MKGFRSAISGFILVVTAVGHVLANEGHAHAVSWGSLVVPFGIATLSLAVLTALLGLLMPKNRKLLFKWHRRFAVATLVAGVCHATLVLLFHEEGEVQKEEPMKERKDVVTMKGNPLTLLGDEIKEGDAAPDFVVIDNSLSPVKFSSFRGKVCIIASVPSLDTSVCDLETRKFNEEAGRLGPDVVILTISMDLPFAQKRWCGAAGVTRVQTFSDHRDASFGKAYGVLIKELRLLTRAVFVVDRQGTIRYVEPVSEMTKEPDYEAALQAVRLLL